MRLGVYAEEQPASLPDAEEWYPRVKLRMNYPVSLAGGGVSTALTSAPLASDVLAQLTEARIQLNRCRVQRSQERRDFETEVRRCKETVKSTGREITKALGNAVTTASTMEKMYMDSKRRAKSWRREAYDNELVIKRLRTELSDVRALEKSASLASARAQSDLSRQTWLLEKATTRIESEKTAYRARASERREGYKAIKDNKALEGDLDDLAAEKAEVEMQRAALERQLEDAVEARQAAQEAAALAQERYLHESWRASEAESAAELAASQREAEEDKVSELESACNDLAGELEQVRSQADVLAQCASALTVPRFKDITRHDISYRTKMRSQHDDKQYLRNIFSEREWRASDVAAVLHETGLLSNVFETKQVRALTVLDFRHFG